MKYFTKYLPVDGEIKEGDKHICLKNKLICDTNKGMEYFVNNENHKKVKLFLCSRDVQVGDRFTQDGLCDLYPDAYMVCTGHAKDGDPICDEGHCYAIAGVFKVIGEISPGALEYVKEGQEFDEDEVKGIKSLGGTIGEDGKIDPKSPVIEIYYWYKIKGPCGHFH